MWSEKFYYNRIFFVISLLPFVVVKKRLFLFLLSLGIFFCEGEKTRFMHQNNTSKREVPRGVRNSKVRRQDKSATIYKERQLLSSVKSVCLLAGHMQDGLLVTPIICANTNLVHFYHLKKT